MKNPNKKRILSLALTLCMIIALLPLSAIPVSAATTVTVTSSAEAKAALEAPGDSTIEVTELTDNVNMRITIEGNVTLGGNKTIDAYGFNIEIYDSLLSSHTLTLLDGAIIRVYENFTCNLVINSGATFIRASEGSYTLAEGQTVNNNGTFQIDGAFTNNGTITNSTITNSGWIVVDSFINNGTFNVNGNTHFERSTFTNNGDINIDARAELSTNFGFTNNSTGVINLSHRLIDDTMYGGWLGLGGTSTNAGTIIGTTAGGLVVLNDNIMNNSGTINCVLWINIMGILNNTGTITANRWSGIDRDGVLNNSGTVIIQPNVTFSLIGGTLANNNGTVTNNGTIWVGDGTWESDSDSGEYQGVFQHPTTLNNTNGLIRGNAVGLTGGFATFTFNNINPDDGVADIDRYRTFFEPSGTTSFNLTKYEHYIWEWSDTLMLSGWFTAATGGTRVDITTATAYTGGTELFAQWVEPSFSAPGGVELPATISGNTVEFEITDEILAEIVSNAQNNTIVLDVSAAHNITQVTFPTTVMAAEGLGLSLVMPRGTVTFNGVAAASIAGQADGDEISLNLNRASPNSLSATQREKLSEGDGIFSISLWSGDEAITEFAGTATITLPWSGPWPAVIWYLSDDGELERMSNITNNRGAGTVTFTTTHFSIFLIRHDEDATDIPQLGEVNLDILWWSLIALSIGGIAVVTLYKGKRRGTNAV